MEAVAAYVKRAAGGRAVLQNHHVQPLAEGGADVVENAVALCPNCHRRMHVVRSQRAIKKLFERIQAREATEAAKAAVAAGD